jgi:riboflavin synthase
MFSGIVRTIGYVQHVERDRGDTRFVIDAGDMDVSATPDGASIACSGCCLTVVDKGDNWFAIDASAETLQMTTMQNWDRGTGVNLEPSLTIGDEIGGHLVTGHVDGLARIEAIEPEGDSRRLVVRAPEAIEPMIAAKGSVCLDGISLTVNDVDGSRFGVNIIPYTWAVTTLRYREQGDRLNIEADILARYALRARAYEQGL